MLIGVGGRVGLFYRSMGYCMMGGALRYNDDFYLAHELSKRCPVKIHIRDGGSAAFEGFFVEVDLAAGICAFIKNYSTTPFF